MNQEAQAHLSAKMLSLNSMKEKEHAERLKSVAKEYLAPVITWLLEKRPALPHLFLAEYFRGVCDELVWKAVALLRCHGVVDDHVILEAFQTLDKKRVTSQQSTSSSSRPSSSVSTSRASENPTSARPQTGSSTASSASNASNAASGGNGTTSLGGALTTTSPPTTSRAASQTLNEALMASSRRKTLHTIERQVFHRLVGILCSDLPPELKPKVIQLASNPSFHAKQKTAHAPSEQVSFPEFQRGVQICLLFEELIDYIEEVFFSIDKNDSGEIQCSTFYSALEHAQSAPPAAATTSRSLLAGYNATEDSTTAALCAPNQFSCPKQTTQSQNAMGLLLKDALQKHLLAARSKTGGSHHEDNNNNNNDEDMCETNSKSSPTQRAPTNLDNQLITLPELFEVVYQGIIHAP